MHAGAPHVESVVGIQLAHTMNSTLLERARQLQALVRRRARHLRVARVPTPGRGRCGWRGRDSGQPPRVPTKPLIHETAAPVRISPAHDTLEVLVRPAA